MKYTLGFQGEPIPRVFNPLIFLGLSIVWVIFAALILTMAGLFAIVAPFSFLLQLRIKEAK